MEYLTGACTLESISEKYGIPFSTLRKRAANESWKKQRNENVKAVQEEAQDICNGKAAKELAANLKREYKIVERLSKLLEKASREQLEIQSLDENGNAKTIVDMTALMTAAKILKEVEAVKRSICGITTKQENRMYDLNREKLDIEKKRLERETGDEDEGGGVLFLPAQEGGEANE